MKKANCKGIIHDKVCRAELVDVFLPLSEKKITVQYCKNKKCENYYICSCGKPFGQH